MNLNEASLNEVKATALKAVKDNRRWTNAINKAAEELLNNPFVHFRGDCLVIWSASGEVYEANGICQCAAYLSGQPCRHRAAYKLMKRYIEREN